MFRFPGRGNSSGGKRTQKKKKGQSTSEDAGGRATAKSKKNGQYADLPDKMKKLRACMICSLIKTESEFEDDGCDNCESFLQLAGTKGAVSSYTSGFFDGAIAMINPDDSWVAKWQRIGTMKPGLYAVNVRGEVEKWVQVEMADAGIPYIRRDKTILNNQKADEDKPKKRRNRKASTDSNDDEINVIEATADAPSTSNEDDDGEVINTNESEQSLTPGTVSFEEDENVDANGQQAVVSVDEEVQNEGASCMSFRSGRKFVSNSSSEESD